MSRIDDAVEAFLKKAEKALGHGLTPRYLRLWAERESLLEHIQIRVESASQNTRQIQDS